MAFSHSAEDQAERWLRALRLHGEVGRELQAMGVGEAPLATRGGAVAVADTAPLGDDEVEQAMRRARRLAAARGADSISTVDLLFGLLGTYGRMMDQALYVRGASLEELIDRLAVAARVG
jgi:hypothetical protein